MTRVVVEPILVDGRSKGRRIVLVHDAQPGGRAVSEVLGADYLYPNREFDEVVAWYTRLLEEAP